MDRSPPDETLAHATIPPDDPPRPAPRKGPRRVAGHDTSERLLARRAFRPAGNSRRFWSRVEDDDPFLVAPPRPRGLDEAPTYTAGDPHERPARVDRAASAPAAANREGRTRAPAGVKENHLPDRGSAAPPRTPTPKPTPKPPAPKPVEPRAERPAPKPAPKPEPPPAPPPIDRRPPRIVPQGSSSGPRIPAQPTTQRQLVNKDGKTASEVRAEAEAARAASQPGAPPPTRNLDSVLSILSDLANSQKLYNEGRMAEATEAAPDTRPVRPPPRPTPRPTAVAPPATPRPPAPSPDDDDDEPPARAATPPKPVDRSPKGAASAGSLDDLFGSNEGRVKVGRRTVPKPRPEEG